jgi:hypothetical protein
VRRLEQKKGQFIIIAVLFIAIMMISLGAVLYSTVTYYKHEPWEEYLTLIGNVELDARHLVELSLCNYTQTLNGDILRANLEEWEGSLTRIYPGHGMSLNHSLVSGTGYNYSLGLARDWYKTSSFSAANATFELDMTSSGLTGHTFKATAFVNLTILNVDTTVRKINVTVTKETGRPITALGEDNFQVDGLTILSVKPRYDPTYTLVYTISCETSPPLDPTVRLWDQRGILVVAEKT